MSGQDKRRKSHRRAEDIYRKAIEDQTRSLEKMAAYASAAVNLGYVAQPERIGYTEVSADLFSILGINAYRPVSSKH
jgi:hypothetical protein